MANLFYLNPLNWVYLENSVILSKAERLKKKKEDRY